MRSLRGRLILGILAGLLLFLGLNSAVVYILLREDLYDDVRRSVEAVARARARSLELEAGRRLHEGIPLIGERSLLADDGSGAYLLQASLEDGSVIGESAGLQGRVLPSLGVSEGEVVSRRITLADGSEHMAAGTRFRVRPPPRRPGPPRPPPRPGPEPVIELVAARDLAPTDAVARRILGFLLLGWISAAIGTSLIVALVVRRTLRPVDDLRDQIAGLDARSLGRSLGVEGLPSELGPVVDQMTQLLERVHGAFQREQSFAGYAAHELRTPIAELRSTLEVFLGRPRAAAEYEDALRTCLAITKDMHRRVETLLLVARSEARQRSPEVSRFALGECIESCFEPYRQEVEGRKLRVDFRIPGDLEVETDRPLLERVLGNLAQNAVRHAREGSAIEVTAEGTEVSISNEAASDPDADFKPGLGLSLAERIIEDLGGSMRISRDASRFRVTVSLGPGPR